MQAVIDAMSQGLRFDGHGAISARGTSRLLYDYPESVRSEILDLLFVPGHAASIQVLKVEMGGDAQSGFGTEPSHRRSHDDSVCLRSRTFWLVREARLRNPALVVYVVPWTFPSWVGLERGTESEFYNNDALDYIVSWLQCANETGAGTVEYVGNRPRPSILDLLGNSHSASLPPWRWVVALREALDEAGFNQTRLVLPDSTYDPAVEQLWEEEPDFASALADGAMGLHYPCFLPLPSLRQQTSMSLWSSEDVGLTADWRGASCLGRSLNTNFVRMNATSTLVRSMAWAVHPSVPGIRDGLIEATDPWSGRYSIKDGLWTLAHTTRFTEAGWFALPLQSGSSGHLRKGGTFVTYISPNRSDFTLVVEKLQAPCRNCSGAITGAEEVVFTLAGGLEIPWLSPAARPAMAHATDPEENDTQAGENVSANRSNLTMDPVEDNDTEADENGSAYRSNMSADDSASLEQPEGENGSNITEEPSVNVDPAGLEIWLTNKTHKHVKLPPLPVDPMTATFSFVAESDTIYTITSLSLNDTIFRSEPAEAALFPLPYRDDFDLYLEEETPSYFADYGGSFQVSRDPSHAPNLVLRQNVAQQPRTNSWTTDADPITLIGHRLMNLSASVDIYIPETELPSIPPRARIQAAFGGSCLAYAGAVEDAKVVQSSCQDKMVQSFILDMQTGHISTASKSCLTAHLCSDSPYRDDGLCVRPCGSGSLEVSNQTWVWHPDGSLRLRARPDLCLTAGGPPEESMPPLRLWSCDSVPGIRQRWLSMDEEMPLYAGACVRLTPRAPARSIKQDDDAGDLLYGLTGRSGYCVRMGLDAAHRGTWRLESGGSNATILASGKLPAPLGVWHRLRLACHGTRIRVRVDDTEEVVSIDSDHTIGAAALLSGWHLAYFDNFALQEIQTLEPVYY